MKRSIAPTLAAALLAFTGGQLAATPQDDATLRQELAQTRASVEALTKELADTRALVDQTVAYLAAQARAADAMADTLASSEQAGFTAGINFQSREILLAGWHQHLSAIQKDLPGAAAPGRADAQ